MAPSGRRPKTKPDDLGCESTRNYTHHRHLLLLLSPKADTHFTVPQRVEGWVDLAGWLHTEMVYPSTDGLVNANNGLTSNLEWPWVLQRIYTIALWSKKGFYFYFS